MSPTVLLLNSLDARYGSTYRARALGRLLEQQGLSVRYVEGGGNLARLALRTVGAGLGRYDLLLTQKFNPVTLAALLLARARRRPVLVDWDDLDADLQGSALTRWLMVACEAVGPRLATVLTTHSQEILTRARSMGRPAFLVPQGFDGRLFQPHLVDRDASRARWGFGPEEFVVGHVCTFTHGGTLDLPLVLDAWAALRDPRIRFLLVGGGPQQGQVEQALARRGLDRRVVLTGLLPQQEVPAALAALDLGLVFMSDRPANTARVSFKALEYLAMDVPVVGRLVGESQRLFGHLITSVEAHELADAIRQAAVAGRPPGTAGLVARFRWSASAGVLRQAVDAALAGGEE